VTAINYHYLCPGCFDDSSGQNPCPSCGYETETAEASLYLIPGTKLSDKYLVGRVLGQGGFGITYLGWDINLDMKLAIKEFFPQGLVSRLPGQSKVISYTGEIKNQFEFGLERFLREAKTLARFEDHPNIVTVRDFFEANNTAYMIMSYVEGLTLEKYLSQHQGKIPFSKTLDIIMPVLDALREVHEEGIMHRDISPDNILINKKGRVILIDFGAARQDMREKSKSLSVILKAGYAPEEQYRSRGQQGPWTDIYAAAATIYRCISGQVPPDALDRLAEDCLASPSELNADIDSTGESALLKALSVRAEGRFQAVQEFQAALMSSGSVKEAAEPVTGKERIVAAPSVIVKPVVSHDANYYIDCENGTIPIGDLPIGARVVDPTWAWEFRTGGNYSGSGEKKPVNWIVVAKNHYEKMEPHVTLLSAGLIGNYCFDESKKMLWSIGSNSWAKSGSTENSTRGLRPWLNSTGIYSGEGFYHSFSYNFKRTMLKTTLPNKEWDSGIVYRTSDHVFIPSSTELGDIEHRKTYPIGLSYLYFQEEGKTKRVDLLESEKHWYWVRSPESNNSLYVRYINATGDFGYSLYAYYSNLGVRPAVNLKADTLISEIRI
jgi:serine/threonine protein kinase